MTDVDQAGGSTQQPTTPAPSPDLVGAHKAECEACNGEGDVCLPDGTGGYELRSCPACDGTGEVLAHDANA